MLKKARHSFVGPEINGKTLGVIGLGAIGVMVANAALDAWHGGLSAMTLTFQVDAAWQPFKTMPSERLIPLKAMVEKVRLYYNTHTS